MNIPAVHASPGRGRLLLAFALMPVVSALLASVVFPAYWSLRPPHGEFQAVNPDQPTYAFAILTGLIAVVVTIAGAVPTFYSLMKRGPVSLKQLLVAGLALGNAPFAVYALAMIMFALMHVVNGTISDHLAPLPDLIAGNLLLIAIGSVFGMVSAAVFWAVAIFGTDASQ